MSPTDQETTSKNGTGGAGAVEGNGTPSASNASTIQADGVLMLEDAEYDALVDLLHREQRRVMTLQKTFCCLLLFAIAVTGATIGTAYYGFELAIDKYLTELSSLSPPIGGGEKEVVDDDGSSPTTRAPFPLTHLPVTTLAPEPIIPGAPPTTETPGEPPTEMPVPPPRPPVVDAATSCPVGNVLVDFGIRFDPKPADVGFALRDIGPIPTALWNFPPGAFGSFSQFNRENLFRVCLSETNSFRFEIYDTTGNGLNGTFGPTTVYGEWRLRFNNTLVAEYNGDCDVVTDAPTTYCGSYCQCQFDLIPGGNYNGGCETDCSSVR